MLKSEKAEFWNSVAFGGGLTEFTAEEKLVDEQANNRVVNQN